MIAARTKAALAAARARGDRGNIRSIAAEGRRTVALKRIADADRRAADVAPAILELRVASASLRGIAAALAERGIPTPSRSRACSPGSVKGRSRPCRQPPGGNPPAGVLGPS